LDSLHRSRAAAALLSFALPLAAQTDLAGTRGEALLARYSDATGQSVWSGEGKALLRFAGTWRLGLKALGEWVQPGTPKAGDTTAPGGHVHGARLGPAGWAAAEGFQADAVSGASSRVSSDPDGHGRVEGEADLMRDLVDRPAYFGAVAHYSRESDFQSVLGTLAAGAEFFDRNTAVAAQLGLGLDIADPEQPPPGESDRWPTRTRRFSAAAQLGQLLSARLKLGLSYAFSAITGPQENPYRRALVHTTLFPERLPETRLRHVAGVEANVYLGRGVALHHRDGLYFDSWGVQALIPETALPIEIGTRWMLTPRHRWYSQSAARFYEPNYHVLAGGWLSGDPRLSRLEGNDLGVELEYALSEGDAPSLGLSVTGSWLEDRLSGATARSVRVTLAYRLPR
jgi:hypothetical protein